MVGLLARAVRRLHPGIDVEVSSQNYAQPALSRVLRGEMDIGLGRWDFIRRASKVVSWRASGS